MIHRSLSAFSGAGILAAALCILCALSLQIQITLFKSETYLGLRINLTDLLVPLAGLFILATVLCKKSEWPEWRMKHIYAWIAAITSLLGAALLNTYLNYAEISQWALFNKFGGWLILAAIMGMGAWVGTNAPRDKIRLFLQIFLCFGTAVVVYEVMIVSFQVLDFFKDRLDQYVFAYYPVDGLMANRNAYGLLFLGLVTLTTCFYFSQNPLLPPAAAYILYMALPSFVFFNGSRATLIALCLIIPLMLVNNWRQYKKILRLLGFGLAGCAILFTTIEFASSKIQYMSMKETEILSQAQELSADGTPVTLQEIGKNVKYSGDRMRLVILEDSLDLVRQSPIIGSGLGSLMIYQQIKHGELINLIDCTPLWVLVEMGAIGLVIFTLFYWQVIKSFWTSMKAGDEFEKPLYAALLIIIFGFTFMCLFHEIMYTRHMWFLIGLGLALKTRPAV